MSVRPFALPALLLALSSLVLPAPALAAASDVAVLLPQKGRLARVAQTIRDGLLAAYYQDSSSSADRVRLRFYDSSEGDVASLLKEVVANGADAVIGPLDREQVQLLLTDPAGPPVPVIALNRADGGRPGLYQLALAPEDEVSALVEWMRGNGVRQPLLLVAGGDEAGLRQLRLFEQVWRAGGGEAPALLTLDTSAKGGVVAGIKPVAMRAGRHDALFLASPALARQILPALTYFQSRLRLYSLSQAWEPQADASGQRDLNGLLFCGLPWLLDEQRPEQQALYAAQPRPDASHDRLYALGADAWSVLRALRPLHDGDTLALRTGRLHLNDHGYLIRQPTCAEVRHGTASIVQDAGRPARTAARDGS